MPLLRMIPKGKKLIYLVNVVLLISCTIHVISIINSIFYPKLPTIRVFKRNLTDMEFPLSFKICAEGDKELKLYDRLGYHNKKEFIRGRSTYDDSIIGWAGHTSNGSTFGTVEGSNYLKFSSYVYYHNYRCCIKYKFVI